MAPQRFGFLRSKLEHEVARKSDCVTLHRSVELFRLDFIEPGKIAVEHYLLPSNQKDQAFHRQGGGSSAGHTFLTQWVPFGCMTRLRLGTLTM